MCPYFSLAALVWVLGGLLALLGALALAEVAVLYPRAGGNYVFLRESYGRLAGFLWGWVELWIIRSASIAALASVFADSLCDVCRSLASHFPSRPERVHDAGGHLVEERAHGRRDRGPGARQRTRSALGRCTAAGDYDRKDRFAARDSGVAVCGDRNECRGASP